MLNRRTVLKSLLATGASLIGLPRAAAVPTVRIWEFGQHTESGPVWVAASSAAEAIAVVCREYDIVEVPSYRALAGEELDQFTFFDEDRWSLCTFGDRLARDQAVGLVPPYLFAVEDYR
jgi:hypothetical protein